MNIPLVRILPIAGTVAFSHHIYSAEASAPTELILGHPPVADRVTILIGGNSVTKALPGQDVSTSFEFSDADGDLEVGSTFTWQYNSGTDYVPLKDDRGKDITSQNLALSDAMAGMQLRVCVTPRTSPVTSLPAHGEERCSSALQVSYPEPAVRSLEFDANNEYYEGKKISLSYEINTHGFPNKSKYDVFTDVTPSQLETQVDNNPAMVTKSLVSNQGAITYTIQNDDVGKLLSFAVLPNNGVIGPSRAIGTNSEIVSQDAPPFLKSISIDFATPAPGTTHQACYHDIPYVGCLANIRYSLNNDFTLNKQDKSKYKVKVGDTILAQGVITTPGQLPQFAVPAPTAKSDYYKNLELELIPSNGLRDNTPQVFQLKTLQNPYLGRTIAASAVTVSKKLNNEGRLVRGSLVSASWNKRTPYGTPELDSTYYKWSTRPSLTKNEFISSGFSSMGNDKSIVSTTPSFTIPDSWLGYDLYLHLVAVSPMKVSDMVTSVHVGKIEGITPPINPQAIPYISNIRMTSNFTVGGHVTYKYDFHANGGYKNDASVVDIYLSEDGKIWKPYPTQPNVAVGIPGEFDHGMFPETRGKYMRLVLTPRSIDDSGMRINTGPQVFYDTASANVGPSGLGIPYYPIYDRVIKNLRLQLENKDAGFVVGNSLYGQYEYPLQKGMQDVSLYMWGYNDGVKSDILNKGTQVTEPGKVPARKIVPSDIGKIITLTVIGKEIDSTKTYYGHTQTASVSASTFIKNGKK